MLTSLSCLGIVKFSSSATMRPGKCLIVTLTASGNSTDPQKVTEETPSRGAMLDLVLTSGEEFVGNVVPQGSLGSSDYEMVEFKILRAVRRAHRKLTALDFRRPNFGLFKDLLHRVS
ncbi:glycerol kinase [Pitangus sulphuratus]|nr:glycerol kinase [Pitangus sulphuratus]